MLALALHVDDDSVVASPDGLSWDSAYADLQNALSAAKERNSDADSANDVDQIRIAGGTYRPSDPWEGMEDDPRTATFLLVDGVALKGGYAGLAQSGPARNERDTGTWVSVLSGDLGTEGDNSDNSYIVVCAWQLTQEAEIDGVTITHGNANGPDGWKSGGGIYVGHADGLTLTNSIISHNSAANWGGGIYSDHEDVTLLSSVIADNWATDGGGILIEHGALRVINSTISGNTSNRYGGAIRGNSGSMTVESIHPPIAAATRTIGLLTLPSRR